MHAGEQDSLRRYVDLIGSFVDGDIDAPEFEERYHRAYLADEQDWSEESFKQLDGMFADADFYVEDDDLREPEKGDLDAAGLREAAGRRLQALRSLLPG